jgi:thiamine biosynthesis lipoprotein
VSLSVETGGAFDVTVAPLVEAWGFGAAGATPTPPDAQTLAALREHTGVRHLELDPQGRWVRTRVAGLQCDFSAFAPGWAADRIAELLEQHGVRRALVDVGGELVARGTNESGVPWQVAVERPQEREHAIARLVPLRDAAIATSGDYRNYREVDGDRVTHIIDPATGRPIGHRLASATVIDSRAVRADALATAVMVLGPEAGMALAERLDLAVMLIVRLPDGRFEQRLSPRFAALTGSTR